MAPQLKRALDAGFIGEYIDLRANDSSVPFERALAQLLLDLLAPPVTVEGGAGHA